MATDKTPNRDKDGNYVNDKGVTIKVSEYQDGVKIDFYDKSPRDKDHKSIHTHINNDGTYKTEDNVKGSKEKSSGSCYLTSACMNYFQESFDDNCEELTILRWFRDNFVTKEDIEHYYHTAPIIVAAIDNTPNNDCIYEYIYENVVNACVEAIKNGDYNFAYNRYKNSILSFEEIFARKELQKKLVKSLKRVNNPIRA